MIVRLVCLLLVTAAWSAGAEEPAAIKLPTVTFGPFPVPDRVSVIQGETGQSAEGPVQPDNPFNLDHPPYTKIGFSDAKHPGYLDHRLTVYRIDDVSRAPYPTIRPIIEKLRQVLAERKEGDLDRMGVPVYPIWNALNLIKVKTQYFDAAWGSGVFFATVFSNGVEEYPDNCSLVYLFEGLSKDEKFFVSAVFKIAHPKLDSPDYLPPRTHASGPTWSPERQAKQKAADAATAKAQAFLPLEPDDSFQPSLSALRQWVTTLNFEEPPR